MWSGPWRGFSGVRLEAWGRDAFCFAEDEEPVDTWPLRNTICPSTGPQKTRGCPHGIHKHTHTHTHTLVQPTTHRTPQVHTATDIKTRHDTRKRMQTNKHLQDTLYFTYQEHSHINKFICTIKLKDYGRSACIHNCSKDQAELFLMELNYLLCARLSDSNLTWSLNRGNSHLVARPSCITNTLHRPMNGQLLPFTSNQLHHKKLIRYEPIQNTNNELT